MKSNKKNNITIDDLAGMVQKGFSDSEHRLGVRIDKIEKRFDGFEKQFDGFEEKVSRRFDQFSNRIDDLALNRVTWEGLKVVQARIDRIEKKLHISLK